MWLVKIVVEVEKICHSDFSVVSSTQVHSYKVLPSHELQQHLTILNYVCQIDKKGK